MDSKRLLKKSKRISQHTKSHKKRLTDTSRILLLQERRLFADTLIYLFY